MHDLSSLTQRIEALEQRVAALEMARDARQHNGLSPAPALVLATDDALEALSRRHTGLALPDLLTQVEIKYESVVGVPLAAAKEVIFGALVDDNAVVFAPGVATRVARNGSPYLSVDFGFGTCAVFHNDVERVFKDTGYLMLDWQRDSYAVEFYPPLSAILERDSRGYPRIVRLWQSDNVLDTPLGDRTGEIPF